MATSLDTTALYDGRPATSLAQQKQRERITVAAYNEARDNRMQSTVWAVVAVVHILIVIFGFAQFPDMMQEIGTNPAPAIGLAIWIFTDVIYLCCYPTIHANYQAQMDTLEGKTVRRTMPDYRV
jgi:hypothetical protein